MYVYVCVYLIYGIVAHLFIHRYNLSLCSAHSGTSRWSGRCGEELLECLITTALKGASAKCHCRTTAATVAFTCCSTSRVFCRYTHTHTQRHTYIDQPGQLVIVMAIKERPDVWETDTLS